MFLCYSYQQEAARHQIAGIIFTHKQKIRFITPQQRVVAAMLIKLLRANAQLVQPGYENFTYIFTGLW